MAVSKVRTRFAPSPTGHLHIGNARTALFNWLLARHHGPNGAFILRIDDTDRSRHDPSAEAGIIEALQWLGLDWDEGPGKGGPHAPYRQSERLDLYRSRLDRLVEAGLAYPCYCAPDELAERRQLQRERGEREGYDGKCRSLSDSERKALAESGRSPAYRLRVEPRGEIVVDDLIRGQVRFPLTEQDDFIIWKSDGMPTYIFATVVDEIAMEITHVVRGEDLLSSTPRQLLVYQALGAKPPRFAHIPLILGPDRKKLGSRHGAVWVGELRNEGYLPDAAVNALALLGWAYDDEQQVFSRAELIDKFALEKVSRSPAIMDYEKLTWLNGIHLRSLSVEELADAALPFMVEAGLLPSRLDAEQRRLLERISALLQTRVQRLTDFPAQASFFFVEDDALEYDEKAIRKFLAAEGSVELLSFILERLEALQSFDPESIEGVFQAAQAHFDKKLGQVIQPVRVAVAGTTVSPPMYDTLSVLGRRRTCNRIRRAAALAEARRSQGG